MYEFIKARYKIFIKTLNTINEILKNLFNKNDNKNILFDIESSQILNCKNYLCVENNLNSWISNVNSKDSNA